MTVKLTTKSRDRIDERRRDLLAKFRVMAERDGLVPGIREFLKETGARKHLWDGELWASWRAFVVDAGFTPNELTRAIPDDEMLRPLAELTREQQRFPSTRELKFARASGRHVMANDKTYRTRFKNRAGTMAALRTWVADKPEYQDVLLILRSQPPLSPDVPAAAVAPHVTRARLADSFVPPVVDCLGELAAGGTAIMAECTARGVDPNVEFERRVGIALRLLGFDVIRLGQGAGRTADGVARCRPKRWAVVYDAKLRRGGFSMGTEDRKFREYIERHGRELEQDGIETVYFAVISSTFGVRDIAAAQEIVHVTRAKAVVLMEAEALRAIVDLKLRTNLFDNWSDLQSVFGVTRIVTRLDLAQSEHYF